MTAQSMEALALANKTRGGVHEFKNHVRNLPPAQAAYEVANVLAEDTVPERLGTARLRPLLRCIRRMGEKNVLKCLVAARVENLDAPLRELSVGERAMVAFQLEVWGDRR